MSKVKTLVKVTVDIPNMGLGHNISTEKIIEIETQSLQAIIRASIAIALTDMSPEIASKIHKVLQCQ